MLSGKKRLKRLNQLDAFVVPANVPPQADVIVTGQITRLDGGSPAKRILIGWGAGHATLAVMGEVRRADGTNVATFSDERIGGGGGNVAALEQARRRVANSVSDMIRFGRYQGGRPGSPGFVVRKEEAPSATVRPVSTRLKDLNSAKDQGLLSDEEYQEQRRKLVNEF